MSTVRENLARRAWTRAERGDRRYLVPLELDVGSNETEDLVDGSMDERRLVGKELDDMVSHAMDVQRGVHENGKGKHLQWFEGPSMPALHEKYRYCIREDTDVLRSNLEKCGSTYFRKDRIREECFCVVSFIIELDPNNDPCD